MESIQSGLTLFVRLAPRLADGVLVTLEVAVLAFVSAVACALILLPLRLSPRPVLSLAVRAYVEMMRNTPLLLQMYLLYFGLPLISLPLSAVATGVMAIGLQHAAYLVEIFRAAVQAIGRDQRDAAKALGLHPLSAFCLVIFPQALVRVLAPLTNQSIVLVKDTTLVSAISVMDLTLIGKLIVERSAASDAFFIIALFYLGLTSLLGLAHRLIERRYADRI